MRFVDRIVGRGYWERIQEIMPEASQAEPHSLVLLQRAVHLSNRFEHWKSHLSIALGTLISPAGPHFHVGIDCIGIEFVT